MPKRKTTQQFIEEAYCKHGDRYNYKLVEYKNARTKVQIICHKHGVFEQKASNHINLKQGCPKCTSVYKKTTQQFIEDAYCKHGDKYNYKFVQYKNSNTKVKIICPVHGVFEQRARGHLKGCGCPKCSGVYKKTTQQFIEDAYCKHSDRYNYKLIEYKGSNIKVKIICPVHGIFKQIPNNHLQGYNCPKCGIIKRSDKQKNSTEQFIEKAQEIHGDKYNYSLVQYINNSTKIKIICPVHGVFEQRASNHTSLKHGCPKCAGQYKEKYAKNNIPLYDTFVRQLNPYGIVCRRNEDDNNILEVKCMYCDRWFIPSLNSIRAKIQCINGNGKGECNLYCSNVCKQACPTYKQKIYPKGFKTNTSREVQPALRKRVLKRDNYTCQKCSTTDTELHCHHFEGIEINLIESADADNCITLCKDCHNDIHKTDKCGIKDYQRKKCV